jgi:monoamine oxidase
VIDTETLIVGGGLSGLTIARELQRLKRPFQLVEARHKIGGRILTQSAGSGNDKAAFDLGPSWFWPGQNRIERLIRELGLAAFEQYSDGLLVYENEQGLVQHGTGYAAMEGSLRLRGGLSVLVDALARDIPDHLLSLGHRVSAIRSEGGSMLTCVHYAGGEKEKVIRSQKLVLALPPRLAALDIELGTIVPRAELEMMSAIPTWMAGHAKVVAAYERPFWREGGFSGDAMSRRGPLMEIHDASPYEGGPYALFGFVGVPAEARMDASKLRNACIQQLARLFGPQAGEPIDLILKDWAQDDLTAAPLDRKPLMHHPAYGLPKALSFLCSGHLILGSTETATQFGGYLEGALEAAERCVGELLERQPGLSGAEILL